MATLDYIKELPDVYRKSEGSNNWKLLSLEGNLILQFQGDIEAAIESLDIHKAKGKTLDLYGEMIGQYRNGTSDEQYRYLILGKLSSYFCTGNYNDIVEQLAIVFDCDSSLFSFIETDDCAVSLESFPMETILRAGMTSEQMVEIIKSLLPSGVKLELVELSGTFTFGGVDSAMFVDSNGSIVADSSGRIFMTASAIEYDENTGFADEAQNIGGYLGAVAG